MYEQSQIILDGELLGNNVIINRPFESIYEISPLIIKNFINIINENSSISKPVRIKKYYFAQNNCINIVFKNKIASGEVQLAYILNKNNELQMDEYKILVTEGKNEACLVATQNVNENGLKYKSSEAFCSKTNNITLPNDSKDDLIDNFFEFNQTNDEKEEEIGKTVEEIVNTNIEESFNDTLELNNNIVEQDEKETFLNKDEKKVFLADLASEDDIFEAKKENHKRNSDRKNEEFINKKDKNTQEETLVQTIDNTNIQEYIIEKNIIEKIYTQNIEVSEQIAEISTIEEISVKGSDKAELSEQIAEATIVENLDIDEKTFLDGSENIDTFGEQEAEEYKYIKKSEIEDLRNIDKVKISTTNNVVECKESNEDSKIHKENNYSQYMNSNIEDFNFIDKYLNNDDLIDFFDVIPKFIDDDFGPKDMEKEEYLLEPKDKEYDDLSIIDACHEDIEEKNLPNTDEKEVEDKNFNELNRAEKIALYQNILKGYDNGMTENKLNKFRENFNTIQNKEDKMTSDDVLDAQVKLLLDNSSKAFRVLEQKGKQDVIQIGEELFLSKDKIYTWGDVYLLE